MGLAVQSAAFSYGNLVPLRKEFPATRPIGFADMVAADPANVEYSAS